MKAQGFVAHSLQPARVRHGRYIIVGPTIYCRTIFGTYTRQIERAKSLNLKKKIFYKKNSAHRK